MEPIIHCPNCNELIIIEQINCGIFRHGILKQTGEQMHPHLPKTECEDLVNRALIYGCGKPFQIIIKNNTMTVQKCEYI